MRALVTGVAGFVGSTLARRLLSEGHEVVGVDVLTDYYEVPIKRSNLASIPTAAFTFHEVDLLTADLDGLLTGVDWVFHQAGQPGVRMSWGRDFAVYLRQNVEVTQRLLEAAKDTSSLRRLIYASSSSVYGNAERYPTSEDDRPQPVSPYGVTKLAAEHLCSLYATNFQVPTVSLRYFTVYGPGQRTDMAFTRFVRAAVRDEPITIFGTGEQVRDFTFVDDVVAANLAAATEDVVPGTVLNVAGGSSVTVNQTLAVLESLNGRPLRVEHAGTVKGDVFRTGGDTTRVRQVLGWVPTVTIEEGLARHLAWGRERFASSATE